MDDDDNDDDNDDNDTTDYFTPCVCARGNNTNPAAWLVIVCVPVCYHMVK